MATPLSQLMPAPNSVIKSVKKYLQQAVRLDKIEPLVAYYCRLYAITTAMAIKSPKSKEDMKLIGGLMTWLETQKQLKAVPKEEAKMRCEAFALQVFTHADNEDRKAYTTPGEWKSVALSFHAAYVFMDVCKQFGELDKEFSSRCLYAKWKTADIFKALGADRLPKAGSFSEQNGGGEGGGLEAELAALDGEEGGGSSASAAAAAPKPTPAPAPAKPTPSPTPQVPSPVSPPPAAAASPNPSYPSFNPSYQPTSYTAVDDHSESSLLGKPNVPDFARRAPPAAAAPIPSPSAAPAPLVYVPLVQQVVASAPPPPTTSYGGGGGGGGGGLNLPPGSLIVIPKVTKGDVGDAVAECEKLIRHASSSLNFEDTDTCITKLREAIAILLPHRKLKS